MATFAGSFAASHGPLIVRDWEKLDLDTQAQFTKNFRELGRRIAAANPDVLVVISPDHWVNFFLNNLPSVCIGVGDENDGPPEPFMKTFPWKTVAGDADFGMHLLKTALHSHFDPAASYRLTLDHGFCIPLWRMELPKLPRIVPVIINALQEPMPTVERCVELGRMIAAAIASYPADTRIAVLGTGGLSHSIGEPTMGDIDETFDRIALDALAGRDEAAMVQTIQTALEHTGNGAQEVRCWAVAAGAASAAEPSAFQLIDYMACPEVYVGCAFGSWEPLKIAAAV
jgi:aromatic ring-opening dioxygenase catalytic subunit (LigB family)